MAKGSQQPQVTEVKTPDPLVVKEYVPQSTLDTLNQFYQTTARNADLAMAKRDAAIASLTDKPYTGTFNAEGNRIDINSTPEIFDFSYGYDPSKGNQFLLDEIALAEKKKEARRERRRERLRGMNKMDEEDKIFGLSRDEYLDAINRVRLNK